MALVYEVFSEKNTPDKITFIEDWFTEINIETVGERELKKFFRDVIDNETDNYIRILGIETLIFLTTISKIRKGSALDILLDIENEDQSFVLITALKYLTMFHDSQDDIVKKLESCKDHEDPEVSSEAYYRLGLINFFNSGYSKTEIELLTMLQSSSRFFIFADQIENRTDAKYFYNVIKFLESFLTCNEVYMDVTYRKLLETSFLRHAFHFNQNLISIEYKINQVFFNLKNIYSSTIKHNDWIDFHKEFKKICHYHYEILNISLSSNQFQENLYSGLKKQVNDHVLKNLYLRNFRFYESKINTIMGIYEDDENLNEFLGYVIELLRRVDKKKDEERLIQLSLQIKNIVPHANPIDLINKFRTTHDVNNIEDILAIISEYTEIKHNNNFDFITGFPTGEEIFNNLVDEIKLKLPDYSGEKLQIFMNLMEQIIKYLLLTVQYKRDESFKFLYTKKQGGKGEDAAEKDLQDSLYKHLQYSRVAYGAIEEINNFADGGRIDIVYQVNNYTFPIELKKTKKAINEESIRENYLEQLNSYVYSYDQLGVFVLLDLNTKDSPVNDIRDLVYLDYIEPLYELKNKYPDYIVVVIIPGNKPLPSDKSTYR
jgi:hypothetical protein